MKKWYLLLKTLPIVFMVVAAKLIVNHLIGFSGFMELSEMGVILTGGIFLMGFMLSGIMQDYKESEKIPAELSAVCESLEETILISVDKYEQMDSEKVKQSLNNMFFRIKDFLFKKITQEELNKTYDEFRTSVIKPVEMDFPPNIYLKILGDFQNIRKILGRISYISKTQFLPAGYAMLEALITLIVSLLFITTFKSVVGEVVIVFVVVLIYTYMYRLICDVDDPFEYKEGKKEGSAEVSLFPFLQFVGEREKK